MISADAFRERHAAEIREALIKLDGDSGAFELLAHGIAPQYPAEGATLFAVVRSTESNRVRVLLQARATDSPAACWHELTAADLALLPDPV